MIHVQSFPVMGGNSYSLWICSEGRMYHCTGCYKICAKKLRCHPGLQFPFECQNTTPFHMGVSFTEMHELRLTSFVHRISREIVIHEFLRSRFCSLMSDPMLFLCALVSGIGLISIHLTFKYLKITVFRMLSENSKTMSG